MQFAGDKSGDDDAAAAAASSSSASCSALLAAESLLGAVRFPSSPLSSSSASSASNAKADDWPLTPMTSSSSSSRSNSPSPAAATAATDGGSLLPLHPESVEALHTPSSRDDNDDNESVVGDGDGGGEDSEAAADLALALPPPVTLTSVCHSGSNYEERVGFVLSVEHPHRRDGRSGGSENDDEGGTGGDDDGSGRVGAAPRSSSPSRRSALMGYSALRPPRTSGRPAADVTAPEASRGKGNKGTLLVKSLLRRKVLPWRRGGGHGGRRRSGKDGDVSRRRSHVGLEVVCGADGGPEVSQLSLFKSNGDEKDEDLRRRPSGETRESSLGALPMLGIAEEGTGEGHDEGMAASAAPHSDDNDVDIEAGVGVVDATTDAERTMAAKGRNGLQVSEISKSGVARPTPEELAATWGRDRVSFAARSTLPRFDDRGGEGEVSNQRRSATDAKGSCNDGAAATPFWTPVSGTEFSLRQGPNYKKTGQKAPSEEALYETVAVRVYRSNSKTGECAADLLPLPFEELTADAAQRLGQSPLEGEGEDADLSDLPDVLIVRFQVPLDPPKMFASSKGGGGNDAAAGKGEKTGEMVLYLRPSPRLLQMISGSAPSTPAARLLARWCRACDADKSVRSRFKCLAFAHDVEKHLGSRSLSWLGQYNGRPVLVTESGRAKRGIIHASQGGQEGQLRYVEMNVDVSRWSYLARRGFAALSPKLGEMRIDLAFTVEAHGDEEMPECAVGCAGLNRIDVVGSGVGGSGGTSSSATEGGGQGEGLPWIPREMQTAAAR